MTNQTQMVIEEIFNPNERQIQKGEPQFKALKRIPTPGQKFLKEYWTKYGKKTCIDDFIQDGREDTEIYATLEKYGSLERMQIDAPQIFADLREIKELREMHEQLEHSENLWNGLPLEFRNKFNNNKKTFMENGMSTLEKMIADSQPKTTENKTEKGE